MSKPISPTWPKDLTKETLVALDVGGTQIKAGIVLGGNLVHSDTFSTCADDGPAAALEAVIQAAKTMIARSPSPVAAIGLAVPGIVDSAAGTVRYSENLGWRDQQVTDIVAKETGIPVALGHDVRSAGLAEQKLGAGRGSGDFVFLPVGTGIAAAIFIRDRLYEGGGLAGEVGHGGLHDGVKCICGLTGCVETEATAGGIVKAYNRQVQDPKDHVSGAKAVEDLARGGNPLAQKVWDHALNRLAETLVTFIQVIDPPLIVIGGGLANSGKPLIDGLNERLNARLSFHHHPKLVIAELGSSAGMWGAALLAAQNLQLKEKHG